MKRYSIYLTKRCNCRCLYCYQNDYSSVVSHFELMRQTEYVLNNTGKNELAIIEFIGGEPLLAIDSLMYCYSKLSKELNKAMFYISTNLTFIPKKLEWLIKQSNVMIFVSIDGDKSGNSLRIYKNKLYIFNDVLKNINYFIDKGYGNKLVLHVVTHFKNVDRLSYHISFLQRLNVYMIDIGIVEGYHSINKDFCDSFIREHDILSKGVINGVYKDNISTLLYSPIKNYTNKEEKLQYTLRKIVYNNHIHNKEVKGNG